MAELQPIQIASTSPGMFWRITSYKPPGRPAYVSAYEGKELGSGCWTCDLMGGRQFRREVEGGRATRRAITDAVRRLLLEMNTAGVIARRDASPAAGSLDCAVV